MRPVNESAIVGGREAGANLSDTLSIVWSRKWLVLFVAALIFGAAVAYASRAVPIYHTVVLVAPASAPSDARGALGQLGGLASLAGIGGLDARESVTEEAFAVIHSRAFLERFISDHDLLPRLFASRWDADRKTWKGAPDRAPTSARGVKYLNDRVIATLKDKKTGLVTLSVDWRDREEAASWANELIARVNVEMRQRAMKDATAFMEYLEKELGQTQLVETRQAINGLIQAQTEKRMMASVAQEYAFRTIDPARPRDADDFRGPKPLVVMLIGLLAGLVAGLGVAIGLSRLAPGGISGSAS